ncbi:MAG: hypothetical protein JHC93_05800 [Parachlamydiales bacterium]|nr:hypothetical protein [Parachlamydiales bacterium]
MNPIVKTSTAAVMPSTGIGDGLVMATLCQNLANNGYVTTLYSTPIYSLREWFPSFIIERYPDSNEWLDICLKNDLVVVQNGFIHLKSNPIPKDAQFKHVKHFSLWQLDKSKPLVDNLIDMCHTDFHLKDVTKNNGIIVPNSYVHKKYPKRVIIHPASATLERAWPQKKYVKLANKLKKDGFDPAFIVSPEEKPLYHEIEKMGFKLNTFSSLKDVVGFINESGYLIGNDSGLGHMASCVGIPTVTLFAYSNRVNIWRPGWSPSIGVIAPPYVITKKLRFLLWKYCITVNQVYKAFKKLYNELN